MDRIIAQTVSHGSGVMEVGGRNTAGHGKTQELLKGLTLLC